MSQLNDKNWNYLSQAYEKGKLNHAYLFCGLEDTGKFDMAIDFACLVNGLWPTIKETGIELADQKKRMMFGGHPDIIIVQPLLEEKKDKRTLKDISTEQIKTAMEKLTYFSYEAKYKILLIDNAQKLTITAANSLLKLIEEPTSDTIIILTTTSDEAVLPTIRSRCQRIYFGLQPLEKIVEYLQQLHLEESREKIQQMAELAQGRVKLAEKLLTDSQLFEQRRQLIEDFRQALKADLIHDFELAEAITKDKFELAMKLEQWVVYFRDFLLRQIAQQSDIRVQKKILSMLQETLALRDRISFTNASERLQVENYFLRIK